MTNSHKITTCLALCLAAMTITFGYGWLKEHEAAITVAAQQSADRKAQAVLKQQEADNQAQLAAKLKSFDNLKRSVQTPAQIVQALPKVIDLPVPIYKFGTPNEDDEGQEFPAIRSGDLIIPQADAKAFYDAQVDCKANEAKAESCAATVKNLNAVMAVKDENISQLQTALKGGTKWHRFIGALETTACAAGGAYIGSRVGEAKGAAVGAVAGVAGCSILLSK